MSTIKKIPFLICTILGSFGIDAQEITGNYTVINQDLIAGDIGTSYIFLENGEFQNITSEHLGKKSISGGDYLLTGDTLVLEYKSQGINQQSEVKLIDKKDLKDPEMLYSKIKVFNEEGKPQSGVNILVQNKERKIVTGFMSDENGRFPALSFYDNYIQYFTLSWIGHREISIPADSLFGYRTEIEVHLKDSTVTYYNPDRTIKFLIKKQDERGFELLPLRGDVDTPIILQKL